MNILKLLQPKPWKQVKSDKPKFVCESCGFGTNHLISYKGFLFCKECEEAEKRRDRFLREEEEWNKVD